MELVSLIQKIRTKETLKVDENNEYSINYEYEVLDGKITGEVRANAIKNGRHIMNRNTNDGVNFYGSINEQKEDVLTGLPEKIKAGLIAIYSNPDCYNEVV